MDRSSHRSSPLRLKVRKVGRGLWAASSHPRLGMVAPRCPGWGGYLDAVEARLAHAVSVYSAARAARRGQPRPAKISLVLLPCSTGDAAALASAAGRRCLDLPAPPDRTASAEPGGAAADRPHGQGESHLGLPAIKGELQRLGILGLGNRSPNDAAPPRARPSTAADGHHLAGVPAPAGRRDRGLRLLHRRCGFWLLAKCGCNSRGQVQIRTVWTKWQTMC